MDIYQTIERDHREFERQLDHMLDASRAGDVGRFKTAIEASKQSVIAHAHAEEAVLYNPMREAEASTALLLHSFGEHAKAEAEIRALDVAAQLDANWPSAAQNLDHDLRHHLREEEEKVFAGAREVFNDAEAEQLGAAFQRMKTACAEDGDSAMASALDAVANLLPPRFTNLFRKTALPLLHPRA